MIPVCCKIAEAQITKIDCENILGLRKNSGSKQTIEQRKLIQKKIDIKHKELRGSAIAYILGQQQRISLYQIWDIQIDADAFSQTQISDIPK